MSLYERSTLERVATARLTGSVDADRFGSAIVPMGREFVVGAPGVGEVHVVRPDGASRLRIPLPPMSPPVPENERGDAEFGKTVASSVGRILVASRPTATQSGAGTTTARLWAFDAADGALQWQVEMPNASVGLRLASQGRIVALATFAYSRTRDVQLFDARDGRLLTKIGPPDASNSLHTWSISMERSRLLVGAMEETGASGVAHEYRVPSGRLVRSYRQPVDGSNINQHFGASVLLNGRFALVGAPAYYGPRAIGAIYVFDRRTGHLVQRIVPLLDRGDWGFGWTLACAGRLLLAGYVYNWSSTVDVFTR